MGMFSRSSYQPSESGQFHGQRLTEARTTEDGMRLVTMYVMGEKFNMWFPGTELWQVNEVVKAWIEHGDDDEGPDVDFSSRIVNMSGQLGLYTFRRSWIAGYKISMKAGEG